MFLSPLPFHSDMTATTGCITELIICHAVFIKPPKTQRAQDLQTKDVEWPRRRRSDQSKYVVPHSKSGPGVYVQKYQDWWKIPFFASNFFRVLNPQSRVRMYPRSPICASSPTTNSLPSREKNHFRMKKILHNGKWAILSYHASPTMFQSLTNYRW
jgi:hypothetical protein